jgi:hypothetical protein
VDPNNKHKKWKGGGVIFVYNTPSLVHMEMQSYSKDLFMMALRRLMAKHGAPRRFQSD